VFVLLEYQTLSFPRNLLLYLYISLCHFLFMYITLVHKKNEAKLYT